MSFSAYKTVWQLKPGVNLPYAAPEESSDLSAQEAMPAPVKEPASLAVTSAPEAAKSAESQRPMEGNADRGSASALERIADTVQQMPKRPTPAPAVQAAPQTASTLPLRKEADIYLSANLNVDYVSSLITYLIRQGLTVGRFDYEHAFKSSDVALLAPGEQAVTARSHTVTDKRALWEFLKREFAGVLKK